MAFNYHGIMLVTFAAAPVALTPYTLTTGGQQSVATVAGVNNEAHFFLGLPGSWTNQTPGKTPNSPWGGPTDIFAVVISGYPFALLRTAAAILPGVQVTTKAAGQIGPPAATDRLILGVTIGAQPAVGGNVEVLVQVRQNPLFVPT